MRSGDVLRRPSSPYSVSIRAFLHAIADAGFEGASVPIGTSEAGVDSFRYVAGDVPVPPYPSWAQTDAILSSAAELLSAFHAASRSFEAMGLDWSAELADPAGGTIVCHNDVCLENIVFRDGKAVVLIDFDFAAPGRPLYDLARFARLCVPLDDDVNASRLGWIATTTERIARCRLVCDAYGLSVDERQELLRILDVEMAQAGDFVRARVEAGDLNFIAMWDAMGGVQRYERLQRWWHANRAGLASVLS